MKYRALFWVAWSLLTLPLLLSGRALVYDDHAEPALLILSEGSLPAADDCWECHQPPLYYLIEAAAFALSDAASASSRLGIQKLLTFAFCVGLWWVGWRTARRSVRGDRARSVALLGFLTFPALFLLHLTLSNDVLAVLLGGSLLLLLWRLADPETPGPGPLSWLGSGALLGLALLAKMTTLGLAPALLATILLTGRAPRQGAPGDAVQGPARSSLWARLLLCGAGVLLVVSPWIAWNLANSGRPLPLRMDQQHYEPAPDGYFTSFRLGALLAEPFTVAEGRGMLQRLEAPNPVDTSLPTRAYSLFFNESLGYLSPAPPPLVVALYLAGLFVVSLVLLGIWRCLWPAGAGARDAVGLVAVVAAVSGLSFLLAFNIAYPSWKLVHAKAIFVMPVYPAFVVLYARGFLALRDSGSDRWRHVVYSAHLIAQALFIAYATVIIVENGLG